MFMGLEIISFDFYKSVLLSLGMLVLEFWLFQKSTLSRKDN